jgi:uncharacterized protein (DUF1786 family)
MRVLAMDVGEGTTDILLWDSAAQGENQTHLIVPSATRVVAAEIAAATRRGLPVLFAGPLMGGGASTMAMKEHVAQGLAFSATPSAARTFDDDLDVVADWGVTIVDADAAGTVAPRDAVVVRSGDVRFDQLQKALALVGESADVEGCAVAVQDHGHAPAGVSDRVFRFEKLSLALQRSRRLQDLFYPRASVPEHLTRMRAAAECVSAADMPLILGDTGPSALWGASLAARTSPCLAVNFGNGHTLMSLVDGDCVDGLFEHHTGMLDPDKMLSYMRRFAAGALMGSEVLADGGHGALPVSRPFSLDDVEVVVTGPRRGRFAVMSVRVTEASLHGDMMLTGCYGLLQGFLANLADSLPT